MRKSDAKLAAALREAGLKAQSTTAAQMLFHMAERAATGYYNDFFSPLDLPSMQLAHDLEAIGSTPEIRDLLRRHMNGEFDADKEESDEWAASPEGQETFAQLMQENNRPQQAGRLAMRHEGEWWNAYWAKPDTMEGAIHLASIRIRFVEDEDRKQRFMKLMRDSVAAMIEETEGGEVTWPNEPETAPESERSGHA